MVCLSEMLIDAGRVHTMQFDTINRMSTLFDALLHLHDTFLHQDFTMSLL